MGLREDGLGRTDAASLECVHRTSSYWHEPSIGETQRCNAQCSSLGDFTDISAKISVSLWRNPAGEILRAENQVSDLGVLGTSWGMHLYGGHLFGCTGSWAQFTHLKGFSIFDISQGTNSSCTFK